MKCTPKLVDFSKETIFVGLDVHKKNWSVTIRFNGKEMKTYSMDPEPKQLIAHLERDYPGAEYACVYEAGFCGFWIQRELQARGASCYLIHPADVPTTHKESVQKSDPIDSRKLARCLENGDLNPIFVPDPELEDARLILRRRVQLVKDRTRVKCRIKQLLHFHGVKSKLKSSRWSQKYLQWLRELEFEHSFIRTALNSLLAQFDFIHKEVLAMEKEIRKMAKMPRFAQEYDLLTTIPSIGLITAMTILTELGDINRFPSLDKLCAYLGFVPNTASSGQKTRNLGISKRGNSFMRRALVECGWMIIRLDPAMALAYKEYCLRMTAKRAIIRIVKKLISRIRFVLKNKTPYVIGYN